MKEHTGHPFQSVIAYHETTKHYPYKSAASPGYMDWDNQPNPFRLFEGVERFPLPFISKERDTSHLDLYSRENNKRKPFDLEHIGAFLELSLALSAWKATGGEQWALRMNPSSGNLHPTEAYLVLPAMDKLKAGVYHYTSIIHSLEQRAILKDELWEIMREHFNAECFLVGLTSIFWRESWKYGERAFRYCNHDVGHALAALSISANLLGWKIIYLNTLSDDDISSILGLNKTSWQKLEEEHPDLMCVVLPAEGTMEQVPRDLPATVLDSFATLEFNGTPNELSENRMDWQRIYDVARAVHKEKTAPETIPLQEGKLNYVLPSPFKGQQIIRKRRSAVDYNIRQSQITRAQFFSMIEKTLPRTQVAPFDVQLQTACIHLFIFVHNVIGLESGLYAFVRNLEDLELLKKVCHSRFLWQEVESGFPLYLLQAGNFRGYAAGLSCGQAIAGDSAFSLGMIAKFLEPLQKEPFRYRHLFWETGMIGQVLYLEAEANSVSATGIGCFYDDDMHDIAGIEDNRFQSLYHFTVGTAIVDHRLMTLPPYSHLEK
jgi:SagB-type dehydrogenase family enzyme